MIEKYRDGIVPGPVAGKDREGLENKIKAWFTDPESGLLASLDKHLHYLELHIALAHLWTFISQINEYIQHALPWKETDQDTLSNTLYTIAESLRLVSVFLYPFMPSTAEKIFQQLNIEGDLSGADIISASKWGGLKPGGRINKGQGLFPRIEKKKQ
jgi:methionyl-tRNA synthetase